MGKWYHQCELKIMLAIEVAISEWQKGQFNRRLCQLRHSVTPKTVFGKFSERGPGLTSRQVVLPAEMHVAARWQLAS